MMERTNKLITLIKRKNNNKLTKNNVNKQWINSLKSSKSY